jgi:hypothetical protein
MIRRNAGETIVTDPSPCYPCMITFFCRPPNVLHSSAQIVSRWGLCVTSSIRSRLCALSPETILKCGKYTDRMLRPQFCDLPNRISTRPKPGRQRGPTSGDWRQQHGDPVSTQAVVFRTHHVKAEGCDAHGNRATANDINVFCKIISRCRIVL